jgi:hypothetical protein
VCVCVCVCVCVNEDTQGERRRHFVWYRGDFKNCVCVCVWGGGGFDRREDVITIEMVWGVGLNIPIPDVCWNYSVVPMEHRKILEWALLYHGVDSGVCKQLRAGRITQLVHIGLCRPLAGPVVKACVTIDNDGIGKV